MKKTLLIVTAAILLLGMVSCNKQKDGVFNPKQKISAVYYSYKSQESWYNSETYTWEDYDPYITPMHKSQEWIWDGKQLQQIRYFSSDGTVNGSETFTYDGKKLVRAEYKDSEGDVYYTTYEYDGKELATANCYEEGQLYESYAFTYTDKKISDITRTRYDYDKGAALKPEVRLAALRMVLPKSQIGEMAIAKCEARVKTKAISSDITRISLTWTDNNVTRTMWTWSDGETEIENYTYDTKKNPYYGFMESEYYPEPGYASENNILTVNNGTPYMYEYDKNDYPTSRTYTYNHSSDTYRSKSTSTYTYEYVK